MAGNASVKTDSSNVTRRGGKNCPDVFQLKAQSTHNREKQMRRRRRGRERATEEA